MYSRKSALGIGIITPSTIIAVHKAKLYVGNVRAGGNTVQVVRVQEEYLKIEVGWEIEVGYDPSLRYWMPT